MGELQYILQKKPLIDIYLVASRDMPVALYQWLFINRYQWQLFRLLAILDEAKYLPELQMMLTIYNVTLINHFPMEVKDKSGSQ